MNCELLCYSGIVLGSSLFYDTIKCCDCMSSMILCTHTVLLESTCKLHLPARDPPAPIVKMRKIVDSSFFENLSNSAQ